MEKQFFRFKTRDIIGILTCITGMTFYKYSNLAKDLFLTNSHLTQQYAEMLIKLDNRMTNFCGYNFKISGFKLIENTERYQSYRMNLKGIRGDCKILVKVQKLDNEELQFLSKQQKEISLMPYEQRKKEPFVPIDFTDILIPTESTLNKLNERVEKFKEIANNKFAISSENESNGNDNLQVNIFRDVNNNITQLAKGVQFEIFEKLSNLAQNKSILNEYIDIIKISDTDTFYRFMNISVSYSENAIFNIRPLNAKYRDYELIDTEYTDKTYLDIFRKLNKIKFQYDYKNNYEISGEELKNELKASKNNYFKEKLQHRFTFLKWQLIFMIGIVFFYKQYFKIVNYQRIYSGVVENLSKNKFLKEKLGNNIYIPYVAFKYNIFKKNFSFNCIAQTGDNKIIITGKSLPNADNVLPTLNFFDQNKKQIKF